jgi:hypothetical protein
VSRPADVAVPGDDSPTALVEHKAQPAEPVLLGCPYCASPNSLIIIERTVIERDLHGVWHVGASDPEIDADDYDRAAVLDVPQPEVIGVRCTNCRWGYKGDRPLDRLQPTREEPA